MTQQLLMKVENVGFLLDRLGSDCAPVQYLRELTQNSIEAIQRTGGEGTIHWEIDWVLFEEGKRKLCIIDTGDGMTGEEMVQHINHLSSSSSIQGLEGNYGVGAKIAAASKNPAGVSYLSWKNGQGSMIELFRDPTSGQYGLKQYELENGSFQYHLPLSDEVKPDLIKDHGTKVILWGNAKDSDTMAAPHAVKNEKRASLWISKYLNTRYFTFPSGVTIRAREAAEHGETSPNTQLRKVTGQKEYLDNHAAARGVVDLEDADAHWWILHDDEDSTSKRKNVRWLESSGHVAALYQNELYEPVTGKSGIARLQRFGITFGYRFIVLYLAPKSSADYQVLSNTARTQLLINNEPLPWEEWADQFRAKMPDVIRDFVKAHSAKQVDRAQEQKVKDRLKEVLPLLKVSKYRPKKGSSVEADFNAANEEGVPEIDDQSASRPSKPRKNREKADNIYSRFERKDTSPAEPVAGHSIPQVFWVSQGNGRDDGYLEDRAARFLQSDNVIHANADFRGFHDLISFIVNETGVAAGIEEIVAEEVKSWIELALIETVMSVKTLSNSMYWSPQHIDDALSEESLTAAVMQKYLIREATRRQIANRIGAFSRTNVES